MGLQTMWHSVWLSKRGLLAPPRWEQSSRGGGEMGGNGRGNPLPKGQGVVGAGRERPLPLPLQDERPPVLAF